VSEAEIVRAIRCGFFPADIERCNGPTGFLTMMAGASSKITRRGRFEGRAPVTAWRSMALAVAQQAQQRARNRREGRKTQELRRTA
jgi:hypothetical protein